MSRVPTDSSSSFGSSVNDSSSSSLGVEGNLPPDIDIEQISSVCSTGMPPSILTGMFLSWIRQHFAFRLNLEAPYLRGTPDSVGMVWAPDATTAIVIEAATRWDPTQANQRPAIYIKRNSAQNIRRGIDNSRMYGGSNFGGTIYTSFLVGSHTFFCISAECAGAEGLATEVYRQLVEFSPVMRKEFQLHRLELAEIAEPMKLEEAAGSWTVPITISWAAEDKWILKPQGPILKKTDISLSLAAR
jgi:hypothetical protein